MSSESSRTPAWQRVTEGEQRIGVGLAVVALILLQYFAPRQYAFQPWWIIPALELAILVVLAVANPYRINRESRALRLLGLLIVGVATFATGWSVVLLSYDMISGKHDLSAVELVRNGGAIWLTNVIVFALWYWELDRGGPAARAANRKDKPDFLFPQMATPDLADEEWEPEFLDYLYVSFTNATAFSPTDTMPLSRWAKLAMMFESAISLVTVALVIARAVNVLGS
ncbi:putative membrane protein [Allocatelliglobosispora scoriae]|uniref:Putative membrane protein n=1 Tax=Allocatelliglobosispora scoriae TaxID=643052 RepID=A0A841BHY7_9ACTN|nr:DUF1345 domain-containing protein [Allocatelliglobosispora scoriae]MBB5867894.1 putative membrane protein [Allocatelliglobosispora scoriae]